MKEYKNFFAVVALVVFIVPQVALAAWWNPVSWILWNTFRPTPKVQQVLIATTTPATSTTSATKKAETNTKQDAPKGNKDSVISSLKKQVADLTQKVSQQNQPKVEAPKTSVITLPSGAVVEMDASGNIIRIITAAPQQAYTSPMPTNNLTQNSPSPSIQTSSQQPVATTLSCSQDTWSCSDWSVCSNSGSQTRTCAITSDCSAASTPSPGTAQSCTPPYTPPSNATDSHSDYNFSYTYSYQYPDPEWIKRFKVAATSRNLRITKAVFRITDEDAVKYDSITDRSGVPQLYFCKRQCQTYALERKDKNTFIYIGSKTGGVPIAEGSLYLDIQIPTYTEGRITNISIPTSEWEIWDNTVNKAVGM